MKTSSKFIRLIKQSSSFLIVGHINPEGDSLGSTLALAIGLKKMGKKDITVLSKDPVPEVLRFLPDSGQVRQSIPRREFDVLIIVDCNTLERTGFRSLRARHTAVIDHHILPPQADKMDFYKSLSASMIDPGAAATGILVYKLLNSLNIEIDKKIATNLYTAILVDTGGFRYSNASPESLKTACHLVQAGAQPWGISKELYENNPFKAMKLLGLSLSTLERKNGIAWITTTNAMLKKTATTAEDCEDFVDYPRKVRGIEVAVFFREDSKNAYKISFRSKGRIDVQKIAKHFGGGGHAAAAGCKIDGTLKEVQNKVFRAVRKAIRES